MHMCAAVGTVWVLVACLVALSEKPEVLRRYHWRVLFWLALTGPFFVYRISIAVWMRTC
jgi:hypothetical protein